MKKKVLILDLDNTIYPVKSIGYELFAPLFEIMEEYREELGDSVYEKAVADIMRKPFQKVAEIYHFNKELTDRGLNLLRDITYENQMTPFRDYKDLRKLKATKFLVTTGFFKLQESKVKRLGIEKDFKSIYIVDPDTTDKTKKDIFEEIIEKYRLKQEDVLVAGDDPESEIASAKELNIDTFLYDPEDNYQEGIADYRGKSFKDLSDLLTEKGSK